MKLYTMKLYTELEWLEYMTYNVYPSQYNDFLDRVQYVKDDPATGEPLYQILPELPPSAWEGVERILMMVVLGSLAITVVVSILVNIVLSFFQ